MLQQGNFAFFHVVDGWNVWNSTGISTNVDFFYCKLYCDNIFQAILLQNEDHVP